MKWIKVEDYLPGDSENDFENEHVLIYVKSHNLWGIGQFEYGEWKVYDRTLFGPNDYSVVYWPLKHKVTHWMFVFRNTPED